MYSDIPFSDMIYMSSDTPSTDIVFMSLDTPSSDIVFMSSARDDLEGQLQESKELLEKAVKALEIESSETEEKPDIESLKETYPWAFEEGEDLKDNLEWICNDLKDEISETNKDIQELIESGSDSDSDSDRTITQEDYDKSISSDLDDN